MNSFMLLYGAFVALSKLQSLNVTVDPVAWESFKVEHGKQYQNSHEELLRSSVFHLNKHYVDKFNAEQSDKLGYKLGLNRRSDWTEQEMQRLNGFRPSSVESYENSKEAEQFIAKILSDKSVAVPDEKDWRESPGRVSRIKDQGNCGSCWTFSSTGALEGQELLQNSSIKNLLDLSEQMLVDCVSEDFGCKGGSMADAFRYVSKVGGIEDEQSYPYKAKTGVCAFDKTKVKMSDKGFGRLQPGDEDLLKQMVFFYGPVSVAIDAEKDFFHYSKGVFNDQKCSKKPEDMQHAVLVVGYGTDEQQGDYWIVKNSWGEDWGEKGYIRMARNKNVCGIANGAIIPLF